MRDLLFDQMMLSLTEQNNWLTLSLRYYRKEGFLITHQTFHNLNHEKKNRILNAAKREFVEKGFVHSKVMAICKRAEIPRSAYYRYFDSLEDCLYAVIENMEKSKIFRFRQILMKSEQDFISLSIEVLIEMLNDEETYLLMSTLSSSNTLNLPMLKNIRNIDFFNANDEQIAIRNALMTVIRGYTKEFYSNTKTKEDCLKEVKILVDILKAGSTLYKD